MQCPKCGNEERIKSGYVGEKQRYKCKKCGCHYTKTELGKIEYKKKVEALRLYLEGLGFRAIGRLLGVSNVSVLNWIRMFGEIAMLLFNNICSKLEKEEIEKMELDEMWHYVKKKQTNSGFGLLVKDEQRKLLSGLYELVEKKQEKSFERN